MELFFNIYNLCLLASYINYLTLKYTQCHLILFRFAKQRHEIREWYECWITYKYKVFKKQIIIKLKVTKNKLIIIIIIIYFN
jgi:hypothetical protein